MYKYMLINENLYNSNISIVPLAYTSVFQPHVRFEGNKIKRNPF